VTFRASVGLMSMCLVLAGCFDKKSASPPTPSTQGSDVSTQVAAAEWRSVIDDWYVDGTFDERHRCVAIREAIRQLVTSSPNHSPPGDSNLYLEIHRLDRRACG
jgi:hypothetical protein